MDLDIFVVGNKYDWRLFDKREAFPFSVVRMPDRRSDIPKSIFYGSFMAETLRIAKATLNKEYFVKKIKELKERMLHQGGNKVMLMKQINKVMHRHDHVFKKYGVNLIEMKRLLDL